MHLFCLTLITVGTFRTKLVPHFLIVSMQKLQNRAAIAIVGRKNEHGQSELALDVIKLEASERTQNPVCGKSYV